MNNASLTPNTNYHPQAGEEPGKPLAPLWIFRVMNPFMKGLLRSPLHRLLSGTLMLLTYTGRKTGKQYIIPIGYFAWGEDELMSFSSSRWWTNLRSKPPVTLLLKGRRMHAVPTVIEEREAVIDTLEEFIKRLGPRAARRLPIGLPRDREPARDDLRTVPRGIALVHFQLT
jgi:F420H(2)-dependent quinone reductase